MYAVVQKTLQPLDPVSMAPAYAKTFYITETGGQGKIRLNPFGILADDLEEWEANSLAANLLDLGEEAYVLPRTQLLRTQKPPPRC